MAVVPSPLPGRGGPQPISCCPRSPPSTANRGVAVLLLYAGWVVSVAHGIDRWTTTLIDSLLDGLNALTGGVLHAIAPSHPYLGSPASTPVTMRMRPADDVELLRLMQSVGAAASGEAAFCPSLEERPGSSSPGD